MRKIYNRERDILYNCSYQTIWAVKYKRNILLDQIGQRMTELVKDKCDINEDVNLLSINIYPNYVQLLLSVSPVYGIHKAVKYLKAETSHALREEFPELRSKLPTLWDNSYIVVSQQNGTLTQEDIAEYLNTRPTSQRKRGDE